MTGAEHYTRAGYLLDHAHEQGVGPGADANIAAAQVHATLALAAATAAEFMDARLDVDDARDDARDWLDATAPARTEARS